MVIGILRTNSSCSKLIWFIIPLLCLLIVPLSALLNVAASRIFLLDPSATIFINQTTKTIRPTWSESIDYTKTDSDGGVLIFDGAVSPGITLAIRNIRAKRIEVNASLSPGSTLIIENCTVLFNETNSDAMEGGIIVGSTNFVSIDNKFGCSKILPASSSAGPAVSNVVNIQIKNNRVSSFSQIVQYGRQASENEFGRLHGIGIYNLIICSNGNSFGQQVVSANISIQDNSVIVNASRGAAIMMVFAIAVYPGHRVTGDVLQNDFASSSTSSSSSNLFNMVVPISNLAIHNNSLTAISFTQHAYCLVLGFLASISTQWPGNRFLFLNNKNSVVQFSISSNSIFVVGVQDIFVLILGSFGKNNNASALERLTANELSPSFLLNFTNQQQIHVESTMSAWAFIGILQLRQLVSLTSFRSTINYIGNDRSFNITPRAASESRLIWAASSNSYTNINVVDSTFNIWLKTRGTTSGIYADSAIFGNLTVRNLTYFVNVSAADLSLAQGNAAIWFDRDLSTDFDPNSNCSNIFISGIDATLLQPTSSWAALSATKLSVTGGTISVTDVRVKIGMSVFASPFMVICGNCSLAADVVVAGNRIETERGWDFVRFYASSIVRRVSIVGNSVMAAATANPSNIATTTAVLTLSDPSTFISGLVDVSNNMLNGVYDTILVNVIVNASAANLFVSNNTVHSTGSCIIAFSEAVMFGVESFFIQKNNIVAVTGGNAVFFIPMMSSTSTDKNAYRFVISDNVVVHSNPVIANSFVEGCWMCSENSSIESRVLVVKNNTFVVLNANAEGGAKFFSQTVPFRISPDQTLKLRKMIFDGNQVEMSGTVKSSSSFIAIGWVFPTGAPDPTKFFPDPLSFVIENNHVNLTGTFFTGILQVSNAKYLDNILFNNNTFHLGLVNTLPFLSWTIFSIFSFTSIRVINASYSSNNNNNHSVYRPPSICSTYNGMKLTDHLLRELISLQVGGGLADKMGTGRPEHLGIIDPGDCGVTQTQHQHHTITKLLPKEPKHHSDSLTISPSVSKKDLVNNKVDPPPFSSSVTYVSGSTSLVTSALGVTSSVATVSIRSQTVLTGVDQILRNDCGSPFTAEFLETLPVISASPTQLYLARNGGYATGLIVGDTLLLFALVGGWFLCFILVEKIGVPFMSKFQNKKENATSSNSTRRTNGKEESIFSLKFIAKSSVMVPAVNFGLMFLDPMFNASVALIFIKEVGVGWKILGVVISVLLLLVGFFLFLVIYKLLISRNEIEKFHKYRPYELRKSKYTLIKLWNFCMEPEGEWLSLKVGKRLKNAKLELRDKNGKKSTKIIKVKEVDVLLWRLAEPVIDGFTNSFPRFTVVDILTMVCLAVALVIGHATANCTVLGVLLLLPVLLHLALVIYYRPDQEFLLRILIPIIDLVQVILTASALAGVDPESAGGGKFFEVTAFILTSLQILLTLLWVMSICGSLYEVLSRTARTLLNSSSSSKNINNNKHSITRQNLRSFRKHFGKSDSGGNNNKRRRKVEKFENDTTDEVEMEKRSTLPSSRISNINHARDDAKRGNSKSRTRSEEISGNNTNGKEKTTSTSVLVSNDGNDQPKKRNTLPPSSRNRGTRSTPATLSKINNISI